MVKNTLQIAALVSSIIMTMGIGIKTETQSETQSETVIVKEEKNLKESLSDKEEVVESTKNSGVVTKAIRFRTGPSTDEGIIKVFSEGEKLKILSDSDGWYEVENLEGQTGWVHGDYLDASEEEIDWEEVYNEKANGTVKRNSNVRKGASTKYQAIDKVEANQKIKVLSSLDGWYKVQLMNGQVGWVIGSNIDSKVSLKLADYTKTSNNNSSQNSNSENSHNLSSNRIVVKAAAYTGGGITATGTVPKWGTIAVDPKIIPYGTKVYIPIFDKVFIAEDCGGAIKGNKIDIYMNSKSECINWGIRSITIEILK